MRDDPYPARYYGRQTDEPFVSSADPQLSPLQFHPTTQRLFLMLLALYLALAIFFMATVAGHAAPVTRAQAVVYGSQCDVTYHAD